MHLLVASLWLKMSTQLTYNKTQLGQSTDLPIIATKLPQQQFLTIFWIFPFPIAEIIRPQILYDSLRKKATGYGGTILFVEPEPFCGTGMSTYKEELKDRSSGRPLVGTVFL